MSWLFRAYLADGQRSGLDRGFGKKDLIDIAAPFTIGCEDNAPAMRSNSRMNMSILILHAGILARIYQLITR